MPTLVLHTRLPTGQVEQLSIDNERVLIGSAAHCEVRLPISEARAEHILIETGPTGLMARALAFEPAPTINGSPFQSAVLPPGAVLGVGGTQILVDVVDTSRKQIGSTQTKGPSPLMLVAVVIMLAGAGMLFLSNDEPVETGAKRPSPPELWDPPTTRCPQADRAAALGYARERMTVADAKRERRPFYVKDGVSAVPIYETAAVCFRAAGEASSANLADESAKYLRQQMTDDFRLRRVRLEHALASEDYVTALKEVRMLLPFVEGRASEYATWLSNLERKLRLKLGSEAESK